MKANWKRALPVQLMLVFAVTRWPGLMPLNFSAAYALSFCAGLYFPRRMAYWLPLSALVLSDLALDFYYYFSLHIDAFKPTQLINYAAYASIIWLGTRFSSRAPLLKLVAGGIVGAVLFYLITNTAAWFFNPFQNPEYTRRFSGWLIALTKGTAGYPETWHFFRNTLFSGGLFTAFFAGAMKLSDREDAAEEKPQVEEGATEESQA